MRNLEVRPWDQLNAGDFRDDGEHFRVFPGLVDEGGLLLGIPTQLSWGEIRGILIVVHDLRLKDLLTHVLDRLRRKELEGLRDSEARDRRVLELDVGHRDCLWHRVESEMLLGIKTSGLGLNCFQRILEYSS